MTNVKKLRGLSISCRDLLKLQYPDFIGDIFVCGCNGCPTEYGYIDLKDCNTYCSINPNCKKCWDQKAKYIPKSLITGNKDDIGFIPSSSISVAEALAFLDNKKENERMNKDDKRIGGIGGCDRTTYVKTEEIPCIKDSGQRRQFETGAVRDIQEGKGRFDLMPLDIVGEIIGDYRLGPEDFEKYSDVGKIKDIYNCIESFKMTRSDLNLKGAISYAAAAFYAGNIEQLFLDVAVHFEEGAKKYGENNWKKGLPIECYIDSGARHLTKHLAGMTDEPHLRAFIWNMLCCIWTNRHICTPTEG